MNKAKKTILSAVLIFTIVLTTIGVSYSYFTVENTDTSTKYLKLSNGTMTLGFANGSSIGLKNIYPTDEVVGSKIFSIKGNNTTELLLNYQIKMHVTENGFESGQLKYVLSGTKTVPGGELSNKVVLNAKPTDYKDILTSESIYDLGIGYFSAMAEDEVHEYILNIYYPETGENQSSGIGKTFSAYIDIEGIEINEALYTVSANS